MLKTLRWAVVTGCTGGIGKAYVLGLAAKGMDIVLVTIWYFFWIQYDDPCCQTLSGWLSDTFPGSIMMIIVVDHSHGDHLILFLGPLWWSLLLTILMVIMEYLDHGDTWGHCDNRILAIVADGYCSWHVLSHNLRPPHDVLDLVAVVACWCLMHMVTGWSKFR